MICVSSLTSYLLGWFKRGMVSQGDGKEICAKKRGACSLLCLLCLAVLFDRMTEPTSLILGKRCDSLQLLLTHVYIG